MVNTVESQDIIYVGDFSRDSEGVFRAVEEARINAGLGLKTGFLHLQSKGSQPTINGYVLQLLEDGSVAAYDPDELVSARLVILIDVERILNTRLAVPMRVISDQVIAIADRALTDEHMAFKNVRLREIFGDVVIWSATTYDVLSGLRAGGLKTTGTIWESFGNIGAVPKPQPDRQLSRQIVGTVVPSRKDHWPANADEIARIWDCDRYVVRVLGAAPDHPVAQGMDVTAVHERSAVQFVSGLDALVYYPNGRPSELPMLAIGTCLANDVPVLLPPELRHVVGKGPIYVGQEGVAATLARELGPDRNDSITSFDPAEAHFRRLQSWFGGVRGPRTSSRRTKRVMMFPSNGDGLGHVNRLLSVARRLPRDVEPVFVSLSQAVDLIRGAGFVSEMIVSHRYAGLDEAAAYPWMEAELADAIQRYQPGAFVFDGGNPYAFMTNVVAKRRDVRNIWLRRGMWRPDQNNETVIKKRRFFDAVIEPRDIAEEVDQGASRQDRDGVSLVDPILLLDNEQLLSREAARRELGLHLDGTAVLVQLGPGNTRDLSVTQGQIFRHLQALPGVQIANLHPAISRFPAVPVAGVKNIRGYPISRYLKAFDFAVSAAGYNSFHELAQSGVPTVFVIRMTKELDDQMARARYAERLGWAYAIDDSTMADLPQRFASLMDPAVRTAMTFNAERLAIGNGAAQAADFIAELAR